MALSAARPGHNKRIGGTTVRAAENWKDYELIDATDGNRLERWGETILVRPDPQVIWKTGETSHLWRSAHAVYHRSASGGGKWEYRRKMPQKWQIRYCLLYTSAPYTHMQTISGVKEGCRHRSLCSLCWPQRCGCCATCGESGARRRIQKHRSCLLYTSRCV